MVRDWDLWPIYLDQRWMDAESARRLAEIGRRIAAIVQAMTMTAEEATERFATLVAHQPFPTARR